MPDQFNDQNEDVYTPIEDNGGNATGGGTNDNTFVYTDEDNKEPGGNATGTGTDNSVIKSTPDTKDSNWFNDILKQMFGTKADGSPNFSGSQVGIAALLAYLAHKYDTQKPTGGGTTKAYAGYTPIQRRMDIGPSAQPGTPGQPIARYAGISSIPPAGIPLRVFLLRVWLSL